MKKLILLCFLLVFSGTFYAQDAKSTKETPKKEAPKKKSGYDYNKDVPVKSAKKETSKTKSTAKETTAKETTKKKSGYNYDKDVPVKSATVKKENKSEANKVDAKIKNEKYTKGSSTKKPTYKETNEKAPKTPDKVTGTYNGKKVYTGPKGGKYYINKNGNKTYIQD
jgi:colicin import membrane protein